jgi:peptidoglycan/LPS O-acetylase OafA/YrhL
MFHFTFYGGGRPETLVDIIYVRFASAGWIGVDLFFVLSGFLITGILVETRDSRHYLRNFYARRVLRIFPLYYGFLLLVLVVLPCFLAPASATSLKAGQIWHWTYLSNVLYGRTGWPNSDLPNYFLGHFWSLAVEEQFYIFWPLLVLLLGPKRLTRVCAGLVVLSVALRAGIALAGNPTAAYVLMPARMDAFAIGAALAVVAGERRGLETLRRHAPAIMVVSSVAVMSLFWRNGLDPEDLAVQLIGFTMLASFFAAMILFAITTSPSSRYNAVLTNRILRFFGRYSYGIYVFHHPLILFLRWCRVTATTVPAVFGSHMFGQIAYMIIATSATVSVAYLSWHLVERRFLKMKSSFAYARNEGGAARISRGRPHGVARRPSTVSDSLPIG